MGRRRDQTSEDQNPARSRLAYHSADSSKKLLDQVADLPLPQCSRLAQLRLVTFTQLEFGDRYRTILTIALDLLVSSKTPAQDIQCSPDDSTMPAVALLAESLCCSVDAVGRVLDAVDQVVRILASKRWSKAKDFRQVKLTRLACLTFSMAIPFCPSSSV